MSASRPNRRAGAGHSTSPDYLSLSDEKAAIKAALADQALALVRDGLGFERPSFVTRSEARWGRKNSFKLFLDTRSRGLWHDHDGGEGGDLLALIQREHHCSFPDAIRFAREWLGWGAGPAPRLTPRAEQIKRRVAQNERAEAERRADEATRRENARRIWAEAIAPAGTPGEKYLRQTRRITFDGPLPASIRWHKAMRVLAFAITGPGGSVNAVQLIAVSPDGSRDNDRWTNTANGKKTLGPMGDGYVLFPATGDDTAPVIYAEGPETSLTLWAAKGFETRALLGAGRFSTILRTAPRNRRIIVARDDDPKASGQAYKQVSKAIAEGRAAGLDIIEIFPWETRREDKSDFNDTCRAHGVEAVTRIIDTALQAGVKFATLQLSMTEGRERVRKRVKEFGRAALKWRETDEPPIHALKVSLGGGKTHSYVEEAVDIIEALRAKDDMRVVAALVPQHALSKELAQRFNDEVKRRRLNINVRVWRGREVLGDNGEPMCRDVETVREAEKVHADIEREVCKPCPHHPNNGGNCQYLLQGGLRDVDIWIGAHDLIFNAPPSPIGKAGLAAVVVDENIIMAGLIGVDKTGVEIPIDALDAWPVPQGDFVAPLGDWRAEVKRALRDEPEGWARVAALEGAGLTADKANAAAKAEWDRKVTRKQEKDWRERKENETIGRAVLMWRAIASAMEANAELSGRIQIARDRDGVKVIRVTGKKTPHHGWRAPTLFVDATLDFVLLTEFWPTARYRGQVEIAAPYQRVTQFTGKAFSKSKLRPPREPGNNASDEAIAEYQAANRKAEKLRRDLLAGVMREHIAITSKLSLVVSNKVAIEPMSEPVERERFRAIAPDIDGAWFGNVAGLDRWKHAGLIVIIGRPLPQPGDIERIAGALTGVAPTSTGGEWYPRVDGFREVRTGRGEIIRLPAEVEQHPDPMCERLRRLICAGQIEQAIGRGRGVNRTAADPVRVIILGNSVAPVPVDELRDADSFAPSPFDLQIAAGGVAFEDGASASAAYPRLWATPGAYREQARRDRNRVAGGGGASRSRVNTYLPDIVTHLAPVTFQMPGAGKRPQRAYFAPSRVTDPKAAIEALLGVTLAKFSLEPARSGDDAETANRGV